MQRHELLELLKELKLDGMVGTFDETVTRGVKRQLSVHDILGQLCQAEEKGPLYPLSDESGSFSGSQRSG